MIFTSQLRIITLFTLALLGACSGESTTEQVSNNAVVTPGNIGDAVLTSGIETQNFDTSIAPGDDFYRYTNGVWLDTTVLPQINPITARLLTLLTKLKKAFALSSRRRQSLMLWRALMLRR